MKAMCNLQLFEAYDLAHYPVANVAQEQALNTLNTGGTQGGRCLLCETAFKLEETDPPKVVGLLYGVLSDGHMHGFGFLLCQSCGDGPKDGVKDRIMAWVKTIDPEARAVSASNFHGEAGRA